MTDKLHFNEVGVWGKGNESIQCGMIPCMN